MVAEVLEDGYRFNQRLKGAGKFEDTGIPTRVGRFLYIQYFTIILEYFGILTSWLRQGKIGNSP